MRSRAQHNEVMGPSVEITVPAVDFAACLSDHSVPYYLKSDIETADMPSLEALLDIDPEQRPFYVSIEVESGTWFGLVRQFGLLERLGDSRCAIAQQGMIRRRYRDIRTRQGGSSPYRFERHSLDPFGEDLPGPWLDHAHPMRRFRWILPAMRMSHAFDRLVPKGLELRSMASALVRRPLPGWFDIHAAR